MKSKNPQIHRISSLHLGTIDNTNSRVFHYFLTFHFKLLIWLERMEEENTFAIYYNKMNLRFSLKWIYVTIITNFCKLHSMIIQLRRFILYTSSNFAVFYGVYKWMKRRKKENKFKYHNFWENNVRTCKFLAILHAIFEIKTLILFKLFEG